MKHICPLCKSEYEKEEEQQLSDKDKFIAWWTPTVGKEEAERSWEEKQKNQQKQYHMVMPDIGGYVSQVDGTYIESRSKHREHLKRHRMVELGNDVPLQHRKIEAPNSEQRKRNIAEQVYQKLKY